MIASTMEAWQWTGTGRPLALHRVPVPAPGPGEVLVRVRAAGLCHSDVGVLDEPERAAHLTLNPITIGHEIAGEITALGGGASGWREGQRVGVNPLGSTVPGYSRDGGYAAYHVAPVADLVAVPDDVPDDLAAIGTDAGMTSHHAITVVAGVRPGMRVGVVGLGGLGQLGAQLAVHLGAEVHAADPKPEARALAEGFGVAGTVEHSSELGGLDLDVAVDFVGSGSTTDDALHAIRVGGDVVLVGLGRELTTLTTGTLVRRKARVLGSSGGTNADIEAVYRYLADGILRPAVESIGFAEIPPGIDRLRRGRVTGRLVVHPVPHDEPGAGA